MAGLQYQVRAKTAGLRHIFNRGVRTVSTSCKRGWFQVTHIGGRRRHRTSRPGAAIKI